MVTIGAPAATTSPARASRYCTRPFRGETRVRSSMIDWMRSTSASEFLICGQGLIALRREALHRRGRGVVVSLALIKDLLGDEPGLHQLLPALEIGFGEIQRALARSDLRFRRR